MFLQQHQRMHNNSSWLVWFLALSATILMVNGQKQPYSRPTVLRSILQIRSAPATITSKPLILEAEDRISKDFEQRSSLTIQPEDRLKLRQSVMDLNKRRRVTATRPTMSPDVISTPNVYHFFSKKRFDRVRNNNLTATTSESPTSSTTVAPRSTEEMAA